MKRIKVYETPNRAKAVFQIVNTLLPLVGLWAAAYVSIRLEWSYAISFLFVAAAGLLMTRVFIFFHDCTHGSFFKSPRANAVWGAIFGILTFTPYDDWRRAHGMHHNTAGNLDKRGVGDIWTMTLDEYFKATPMKRFWYRVYRNPVVLFLILPPVLFFIIQRFPHRNVGKREIRSVLIANAGVFALNAALVYFLGWEALLLIQLPMFGVASILGVWLFYVQHQFDPGYWEHEEEWEHIDAALLGSSHYKLPKVLQWVSGNIGLHHIHHCRPRIPNYNLQACYDSTPELQLEDPLTVRKSLASIRMNIWDEAGKRLMSFRQAHAIRRAELKELAAKLIKEKLAEAKNKLKGALPSV